MKDVDKSLAPKGGILEVREAPGGGQLAQGASEAAREALAERFFARIANDNTRKAYLRDAREFAAWTSERGLSLEEVRPLHVAAFRDGLVDGGAAPTTVKRKMSALRGLYASLVEAGTLSRNPAREVATARVKVRGGKTPALTAEQTRALLDSFDLTKPIQLRDRALVSTMAYSLARVSAALSLKVRDYVDVGRTPILRLKEKGGVERDVPAHPTLATHLDEWLQVYGPEPAMPLFPAFEVGARVPGKEALSRRAALRVVKRRLKQAGLPEAFSNHSFRATGITELLTNGASLETAQELACHADPRTTKLYDRRGTRLELEEILRIRY